MHLPDSVLFANALGHGLVHVLHRTSVFESWCEPAGSFNIFGNVEEAHSITNYALVSGGFVKMTRETHIS